MSYSLYDYAGMAADRVRVPAYVEALRRHVTPDSVVVELGTGYGAFALMAARLGARKVYAIEPNPAVLVGPELLAANPDLRDRVEFIEGLSHGRHSSRARHLAALRHSRPTPPHPRQPARGCGRAYAASRAPAPPYWRSATRSPCASLMRPRSIRAACLLGSNPTRASNCSGAPCATSWCKTYTGTDFTKEMMLVEGKPWAVVDYTTVESPNVAGTVSWTCDRPGTAHGLAAWFDTEICDGIGFSNAPGQPKTVYGRSFLPFERPMKLSVGDQVSLSLDARELHGEYLWRWDTQVRNAQGATVRTMQQSNFFAAPLAAKSLHKRAADHIATLSERGLIDLAVLEGLHARRPLRDIAEELMRRFPERYPTIESALGQVGELSVRYGV